MLLLWRESCVLVNSPSVLHTLVLPIYIIQSAYLYLSKLSLVSIPLSTPPRLPSLFSGSFSLLLLFSSTTPLHSFSSFFCLLLLFLFPLPTFLIFFFHIRPHIPPPPLPPSLSITLLLLLPYHPLYLLLLPLPPPLLYLLLLPYHPL